MSVVILNDIYAECRLFISTECHLCLLLVSSHHAQGRFFIGILSIFILNVIFIHMLSVVFLLACCVSLSYWYAECRYTEYHSSIELKS
jgi:hypothetical protein